MATVAHPPQPAAGATAAPTVEDLVPGKVASRKKSDALAVKVPGRARPPREASPASVNGFPALEDDATDGASVEQEAEDSSESDANDSGDARDARDDHDRASAGKGASPSGSAREGRVVDAAAAAALAPVVKPDPVVPGLFTIDIPELRLDGPCLRSCCAPANGREWLRKDRREGPPRVTPPLAPGTEPTVIFGACEAACDAAGLDVVDERTSKLFVRYNGVKNNGVKAAFKTAGFRTVLNKASEGYNAVWNGCLKNEDLKRVNRYQRVNHFPGTWEVGRKDRLSRNIGKARRRTQGSDDFDIHPRSFVLPADSDDWRIECDRYPDGLYIIKPPASSRGRGIKMMRRPSDIKPDKDYLIQRYIRDPHLIDGYKYDIRVYVAVTCLDPLRVYAYREGLVRLATERYTNDGVDLNKRCMHLTNYSVNSKKEAFTMGETAEDDDVGFKWSLSALRRHFDDNGLDFESTWARMKDVIVKTMIAVESPMNTKSKMFVPDRRICYEIFGFDIMLDSRLTPWLIEVNTGPSLSAPSKLDMHVKHRMLANLFNLVGVTPYDRAKFKAIEAGKRRARLTGVPEPRSDPRVGRATIDIASAKVGSSSWRGKPSGGGNPAAAANAFPKRKDVKALNGVCFDHFTTAELPEVIRESDAELGRAQEFERCFPASSPRLNDKYMALFEGGRSLSRQGRASTPTEFGGGQHDALGGERYVRGRAQPRTAAAAAAGAPAPDGGRAATVSAVSSARGGVRGGALRGAQPQPRGDSPARPFGAVGRPGGSFARVGAGVGAGVVDLDLGASLASTLTLGGARAGRPGRGGDGGDGGGGGVAFGSTRGGGKGGLGKGSGREKAPSFFVGPPR